MSAKIILMHKKDAPSNEKLIYVLVPFLLYSFYYSMLLMLGLILFIIPGFLVMIYFSQAPLVAALAPMKESYFKKSISLVKKNVVLVVWISFTSFFLEFTSLIFAPIADQKIRWTLTAIFSLPDSLLTIILTIVSVKIFYYLSE
jgi:hypothetical protein